MIYSLEERVEMVLIYGANNESARRTATAFNERHPDRNVSHVYVMKLLTKFRATGSVGNAKHNRRRTILDEAAQIEVLGHFVAEPTTSIRKVSKETRIATGSIQKVTKIHKFKPYKMHILHELQDDDHDRRIQFCEIMTEFIKQTPNLLQSVIFSDECTFFLNGKVNKQNCRYWSDENPHQFREGHTQYPQKINVWAGILGNTVIGPLFINGNLTAEVYLNMLDETVDGLITEAVENQRDQYGQPLISEDILHFQQDGAPPHYAALVREWLDNRFPGRWIGRRGPIEWPARSPDLSPNDFFLWGHLKSVIYKTAPENIQVLKNRITTVCRAITPETFQKVRQEFEARLYYCLEKNGEHFEHLIN